MRKQQINNVTTTELAQIQGYHNGVWTEAYAFNGFKENLYFTSDRTIKLDGNFVPLDGKTILKGIGIEVEVECNGISNSTVLAEVFDKIIFPNFPKNLFKMQRDGSLGGDTSVECITQVMTKECIRNNYPAFKKMFNDYFKAFNISASRTGNCGMHVNISKALFGTTQEKQDEAIRKLYYFINKNYNLSCKLFARDLSHTRYCSRMDYSIARTMNLAAFGSSHGVCFNLGHYNSGRIELRLVGGQKNYACFRNTMECVFFLINAMKKVSWTTLESNNFATLFKGCNQYVYDRLESKCFDELSIGELATIKDNVETEELL